MCDFTSEGRQCEHRGVISFGTTGGGPWYCREHADVVEGRASLVSGNRLPPRPKSPGVERYADWRWDAEQRRLVAKSESQEAKEAA